MQLLKFTKEVTRQTLTKEKEGHLDVNPTSAPPWNQQFCVDCARVEAVDGDAAALHPFSKLPSEQLNGEFGEGICVVRTETLLLLAK